MMNIKELENILGNKLQLGKVNFTHEDDSFSYFHDDVMDIRVNKEIKQDRHGIDIKEANTNEEYGFYGVVLSSFIR